MTMTSLSQLDVTQTWPKMRLTKDLVNDAKSRIRRSKAIERAKEFVEAEDDPDDDERTREVREMVRHLYEELEQRKAAAPKAANAVPSPMSRRGSQMPPQLGIIREEPHFGSMIFCDTQRRISRAASQSSLRSNPPDAPSESIPADDIPQLAAIDEEIDPKEIYDKMDPFYIRAIPHMSLFVCAALYVFAGAFFFQHIDPDLHRKPYREIVLFTYQICATIGWGDTSVTRPWSRVACVAYSTFGIPLVMAAFANLGRLFTEFYCIDWIFLTSVVRGKKPTLRDFPNELPVKGALNLLFIHQCVGLVLFNGLMEDLGVIGSIYFSVTTMATIGFGDIVPKPTNGFELAVILLYASSGIVILSALFISISYYIQLFYYGYMAEWLHWLYKRIRKRIQRKKIANKTKPPPTRQVRYSDSEV